MEEESCRIFFKLSMIKNVINQQLGVTIKQSLSSYYSTQNILQNLKPTTILENCPALQNKQISEIQFNCKGNLIANVFWGNDTVQIYDWASGRRMTCFSSGHNFTVRQVNWIPADPENLIVTSGQYGDIRLMDLTTNTIRSLENSFSGGFKFCVNSNLPYSVLAGSRKGKIVHIDIRESKPMELLFARHKFSDYYEISGIDINPTKCFEFCIAGRRDLRVYDCRNLSEPVHKLILDPKAIEFVHKRTITVKYNYDGTEILTSYSEAPILLFNTLRNEPIKTYELDRLEQESTTQAIFNIHFLGSRSDFIVASGAVHLNSTGNTFSNNIYIWDKDTGRVVHIINLEEKSCRFAPHPFKPILAMNLENSGIRMWQ